MLKWFRSTEAESLGRELAADIMSQQAMQASASKKADIKAARIADSVLSKAAIFKQQQRPNLYQKAKLLNTVKWELRDSAVPEPVIDEFISQIARRL